MSSSPDPRPSAPDAPASTAPPAPLPLGGWRRYATVSAEEGRTVVGDLRVFAGLYSPQLDNRRDVLVHLPPSYPTGTRRYPVLYMQDAQNLFDEATSFTGEWRVDETMEALAQRRLEAIVVGVQNMSESRVDEYSPFRDPTRGGGAGDRYLDFLVDTVKAKVDRDFRTLPGPAHTGVIGSSMGGLISLYAFVRRPDVFGRAGVMSPAVWFARRAVLPVVERAPLPHGRLYLDIGREEGAEALTDARRLRDLLLRKGYRNGADFRYVEDAEGDHSEAAWGRRLPDALAFLLGGPAA